MLHLHGVSKQYGSKILFEGADAHIGHRSRVALIGPNGAGKSTIIRIILGQESADSGEISRANHLAIGHLAQEVPKFTGRDVLSETMRLDGRRDELVLARQELEAFFEKSGGGSDGDALVADQMDRYGRILEELDSLDEYRLEARAKRILSGMGFKQTDFARPLTEFSGGWLMRVALSRVLLMEPDLLLLDEPTNHLDLESLLWLEGFLQSYRGAMLLVSHDSEFLNRMVTEVLEIDQKKLFSYRGNLDAWGTQKEERLTLLRAQYAGQQSKIAELESFINRFGAKATKARQAQSRQKQLDKMDLIELPEERSKVGFRFPPAPHSGKEVVTLKRASFSYPMPGTDVPKPIFKDLDWVIPRGSRVAIVGVNGAGKTTLLKLLAGNLSPEKGELKFGHQVQIGYYAQHQAEGLNLKKTVLEELEATAPELPVSRVRGIAGAFLFSGDAVDKKCGVLSGGEKARVALAKLLLSPSNFLLLDEPTNHLDVESRGVLLEALQDYEGTLCLISHDRAFVGPLVDSVLEIEPSPTGSRVTKLIGTYDDYIEKKRREIAQADKPDRGDGPAPRASAPTPAPTAPPAAAKAGAPSNNQRRAWEKERDSLEGEISELETRQAALGETLSDTAVYEDKPRFMKLIEEQREVEASLSSKLARWEKLCARLEAGV